MAEVFGHSETSNEFDFRTRFNEVLRALNTSVSVYTRTIKDIEESLPIMDNKKRYSHRISAIFLGDFLRKYVYKQPEELYEIYEELQSHAQKIQEDVSTLRSIQDVAATLDDLDSDEREQLQKFLDFVKSITKDMEALLHRIEVVSREFEEALGPIRFKPFWSKEIWEQEFGDK